MSYVETTIIIAALDQRDPRCRDALSILESEEYLRKSVGVKLQVVK